MGKSVLSLWVWKNWHLKLVKSGYNYGFSISRWNGSRWHRRRRPLSRLKVGLRISQSRWLLVGNERPLDSRLWHHWTPRQGVFFGKTAKKVERVLMPGWFCLPSRWAMALRIYGVERERRAKRFSECILKEFDNHGGPGNWSHNKPLFWSNELIENSTRYPLPTPQRRCWFEKVLRGCKFKVLLISSDPKIATLDI